MENLKIISWITAHTDDILMIIGALYTVALVIVKLTPTPKDDAALENVNVVLKAFACVFGLDLKQGINTKPGAPAQPSGKAGPGALLLALIAAVVLCQSCAPLEIIHTDPRAECVAAHETFAATVRSLAVLRAQGVFDPDEEELITALIDEGQTILGEWYGAVLAGDEVDKSFWAKVQGIITRLSTYQKREA